MKKRLMAAGMLLCLCLTLFGCTGRDEAKETAAAPLLLGFSQIGSESAWRIANTEDMERAAEKSGVSLMLSNANQQQEKQIDAIRSFIAYQVDVIAFSPIVETGWDNVLNEAKLAGIPVIVVDRMIDTKDDTLYSGWIGADFYAEGVKAAQYLLGKADAMGGETIHIVEIAGTIGSTPMRERSAGFWDTLAGDDRFQLLESVSGDFLLSKGRECMRRLLDSYGDEIDVLYAHNDEMTIGAIETVEAAGLAPGRDMQIITIDGGQQAIDLLKAGKLNCVVECTPMLGDAVMALAQKLADGQAIPKESHPEEKVFSDEDELTEILPRGY